MVCCCVRLCVRCVDCALRWFCCVGVGVDVWFVFCVAVVLLMCVYVRAVVG